MFKASILNQKRTIFEGKVESVFLPGTEGEFEVKDFHKPLISLLKQGEIVINWDAALKIKKGVVIVTDKELTAVVEDV